MDAGKFLGKQKEKVKQTPQFVLLQLFLCVCMCVCSWRIFHRHMSNLIKWITVYHQGTSCTANKRGQVTERTRLRYADCDF